MKKWIKWTLILGIIFCVLGVGIMTAGAVKGGGDPIISRFFDWSGAEMGAYFITGQGDEYEMSPEEEDAWAFPADETVVFEGVMNLKLEHCDQPAEIRESEELSDGQVGIMQPAEEGQLQYLIRQEGGELKISLPPYHKSRHKWNARAESPMTRLLIYVPQGFRFTEVEIENLSGSLLADALCADELSVESLSGSIQVLGGSLGALDAECLSGSVDIRAAAERELSAELVSGKMELLLKDDIGDYDYEINRTSGQITLSGSTTQEYNRVMGETRIDNHTGREVEIDCVSGQIMIHYEDGAGADAL